MRHLKPLEKVLPAASVLRVAAVALAVGTAILFLTLLGEYSASYAWMAMTAFHLVYVFRLT